MANLFKGSKQVLAFVFAFAILAVSLFTGGANITADACDASKIDYWDGTIASEFSAGDGSEQNPYIIKTAEELARCCMGQNKTDSKGKFYKVDDSVKIFVMQPEGVVDLNTLLALDSAEATKEYISGLSGKKNWLDVMNTGYGSFNGNFDGNYATVYGLYADSIVKDNANLDCGLFPRYDGGYEDANGNIIANVCKNIAVKNSYFGSIRRVGVISGASYAKGYGADVNGIIHYDTIQVINCYITAVGSEHYFNEQGIIADGGAGDVSTFNNCLVKGTYAFNTEQNKNMGILAAAQTEGITDSNGELVKPKISNSIFVGVDPFRKDLHSNVVAMSTKDESGVTVRTFFENVLTDQPAGKVVLNNPSTWGSPTTSLEFTEAQVKQITATGFDFAKEATSMDWENNWFMAADGPELRAFHGEIVFEQTATTHVWKCVDCGLTSPGGVANHNFVLQGDAVVGDGTDVYTCKDCNYTCTHGEQTDIEYDAGDCVTASGYYARCKFCDWYIVSDQGKVPGHIFTYVEADPGHCEKNGHKEYWECSVCKNKFASNDIYAAMDTAVTDEQLDTGLGTHLKEEDEYGVIVLYDENGHWYKCAVDGGRLDYDSNVIAEDEVVKHKFKNAVCTDCGYKCENHDYKETGKLAVVGDCVNDEETEIKCTKCGYKNSVVTKPASHDIVKIDEVKPNDQKEGTKAHYKCDVCNAVFSDKEGTKSLTRAELVIPKVLPSEYEGLVIPNADSSNKSPSTGDSLISIFALAALAGVTVFVSRKAGK